MPSVLFVCTANRFRSPLAQSFFQAEIRSSNLSEWKISSAGTWTKAGLPALDSAVRIAAKYGQDISSFRSTPINTQVLKDHKLILVMESNHKEALNIEYPFFQDRIYLLTEALGQEPFDIPDPISSDESPESIGFELYSLIKEGIHKITTLAVTTGNDQVLS